MSHSEKIRVVCDGTRAGLPEVFQPLMKFGGVAILVSQLQ